MLLTPGNRELSDVSYTHLREENERLKANIVTYRHELDMKKKDDEIVQAQVGWHGNCDPSTETNVPVIRNSNNNK